MTIQPRAKLRNPTRVRPWVLGLSGAAMIATLAGCAGTAHDEYYRIRGVSIKPNPGDSRVIVSVDPAQFSRADQIVAASMPRGTLSDQASSAE